MAEVTPGTLVGGKYRLEQPIGKGGMAAVWRATHTTLEAPVAVKLLDTFGSSRARMKKRFVREAKLAANLKHQNVVHILDYGVMEDGQPFMIMELLQGDSLAERLDSEDRALTDLEVFEIGAQILSGLAAVHDAGIVHRDVKPENIFLVRDADGEYPKLLDFGISRSLADTEESRMTNTGMVVGTPLYMSPEQARGLKDIDVRSDLWSVGMILYEALTGDVPFDSENMGDILIQVATEEVPPLEELRPDLPASLIETVMRALEKKREDRWQDARSMRAALLDGADQLASGQTVVPRPGRRAVSSKIRVGRAKSSDAEWEDADTAIDPDALKSSDDFAPPTTTTERTRAARPGGRWWPFAAAGAVLAVGVVGFVALGGEIRFQSAAAEPEPSAPDTVAHPPPELSPEPDVGASVEVVAPDRPADDSPELAAAELGERDGDPGLEPGELETASDDAEPSGAGVEDPTGDEEAPDAEPVATADRRSRRRRRRAVVPTPTPLDGPSPTGMAQSPTNHPSSSPASGSSPTRMAREPASGGGRRGGFVRDLDY